MDHRPFEDWLLAGGSLTPQQKHQLDAHLQECHSCSALAEVDLAFRSARQAEPAAGFVERFQSRLLARKQALRRRNALGFALLIVSVAGLLLALSWPVLRALAASPLETISSGLAFLVALWASIQALFHAGSVLFHVAPGFVPLHIWAIALFLFACWSVISILPLVKFVRARAPSA